MRSFKVIVNGNEYEVGVEELKGGAVAASAPVAAPTSHAPAPQAPPAASKPSASPPKSGGDGETITAQMPGTIVDILVTVGDSVTRGQSLLVLEAMKMANQVVAHQDGTVAEIAVGAGDLVNAGDVLVVLS